jgi:Protein of unknown function (DUF2939)/GYF domain 2
VSPGPLASDAQVPPHPLDKRWYTHLGGKTYGPYTGHEIRDLVDQQKIGATDFVYAEGGNAWTQVGNDPILQTLFSKSAEKINWLRRSSNKKDASSRRLKVAIILVLAGITGWVAWPYYTVYELANAVREGDVSVLESRVAWDSVRQGLRDDLNAVLLKKLNTDAKTKANEPDAAFGAGLAVVLGPAIIDRMIDSYVTPQAIATFNHTGKTDLAPTANNAPPKDLSETIQEARRIRWDQVQYAFFSGGPLTFKVKFIPDHKPPIRNPITLLFRWDGSWRLTRILLPPEAMDGVSAPSGNGVSVAVKKHINTAAVATKPPAAQSNVPMASGASIRKELAPLELKLLSKGFKDKNIQAGDFEADITIALAIKNVTDKDIRAFDGVITFTDLLDNEILSSKLAINELIKAGSTFNWKGAIKYNQFIDAHERLRNERQDNLKMKFVPRRVLFADGSAKNYSGQ